MLQCSKLMSPAVSGERRVWRRTERTGADVSSKENEPCFRSSRVVMCSTCKAATGRQPPPASWHGMQLHPHLPHSHLTRSQAKDRSGVTFETHDTCPWLVNVLQATQFGDALENAMQ